jgi:hypothetical protein
MNKKVLVLGIVALLAIGGLVASNMGFKLNYRLEAAGATSVSGTNMIGLPYNRQTGLVTANNLMNDIGLANVATVSRFLEANDGLYTYTGRRGSPADFNLAAGEGYLIKMNTGVDYIVVGSHDPSLAISLDAAGAGSVSGTNMFAIPYHTTAATANDLMNDIGLANVATVSRFLEANDGLYTYTGRRGSPADFNLVPGEAYLLKMNNTVSYVPSHY